MKKFVLAALAIAALVTMHDPARSAEPQPTTGKITVAKAVDLLAALNGLSAGREEIVGQGASQRVIAVPYNLSADTLWAIADNITALRKVVVGYQEVVRSLTAQAEAKSGTGLPLAEGSAAHKALAAEIQKTFESERPIDKLARLKRDDLKLGENKIPPQLLSSLAPILNP